MLIYVKTFCYFLFFNFLIFILGGYSTISSNPSIFPFSYCFIKHTFLKYPEPFLFSKCSFFIASCFCFMDAESSLISLTLIRRIFFFLNSELTLLSSRITLSVCWFWSFSFLVAGFAHVWYLVFFCLDLSRVSLWALWGEWSLSVSQLHSRVRGQGAGSHMKGL